MTTAAATPLLTAEEFATLPQPSDGSQQELIKGVIVTMPPPSFYHGRICLKVGRKLGNFIEDNNLGTITSNDSGVILARNPDTVRAPDLAYWSYARLPEPPQRGYPSVAPDLVVEVLSPSDVFLSVNKKVHEYLTAGVRLLWVLMPEDRSVTVYRHDRPSVLLANGDTLGGEGVLPGFSCLVGELFP